MTRKHYALTIIALVLLAYFGANTVTGSLTHSEIIVLEPHKPILFHMTPFELREVYIPVNILEPNFKYTFKASFQGGYAIEVLIKRKTKEFDELTAPKADSDYIKRYGGLGMRDHRYPSVFYLNEHKAYQDDPNENHYEITKIVNEDG